MSSSKLSSGTHTLLKQYSRVLRQWPADNLRPIQFQSSVAKRLQARFIAPTASANPSDSVTSPTSSKTQSEPSSSRQRAEQTAANLQGKGKPSDTASSPTEEKVERVARMTPAEKEQDELEQVNALYSLLENRYANTYPCSERLLRPGFKEGYYEELAREMEVAPGRSWWMQKWLRWRSIIRLS